MKDVHAISREHQGHQYVMIFDEMNRSATLDEIADWWDAEDLSFGGRLAKWFRRQVTEAPACPCDESVETFRGGLAALDSYVND